MFIELYDETPVHSLSIYRPKNCSNVSIYTTDKIKNLKILIFEQFIKRKNNQQIFFVYLIGYSEKYYIYSQFWFQSFNDGLKGN